jgi:hypothetical protein
VERNATSDASDASGMQMQMHITVMIMHAGVARLYFGELGK